MAQEFSYEKSINEIEEIIDEIENGTIDIDELSKKVKRATSLIKKCQNKLTGTQKEIDELLETME